MHLILKYILRSSGRICAFFVPQKSEYFNYKIPAKIYQKFFIKNIIFLNVGADCRAALHLKAYLLRKLSSPLDWIMCYSLQDVYMLYKNEFIDFFKVCSEDKDKAQNGKRFVIWLKNGMVAMHHFPLNIEISTYLPTFQRIMQTRFKRLKAKIIESKSVVFVTHRQENIELLQDFILKMQELINVWCEKSHKSSSKQIFLVNILHKPNSNKFEKQIYKVGDNLKIIQFSFDDTSTDKNHWLGNKKFWGRVMGEIERLG